MARRQRLVVKLVDVDLDGLPGRSMHKKYVHLENKEQGKRLSIRCIHIMYKWLQESTEVKDLLLAFLYTRCDLN